MIGILIRSDGYANYLDGDHHFTCIHISKQHAVYLKYTQFLFAKYTSIKLGEGLKSNKGD